MSESIIVEIGNEASKMVKRFEDFVVSDTTKIQEVLDFQAKVIQDQMRIIAKFMRVHGVPMKDIEKALDELERDGTQIPKTA